MTLCDTLNATDKDKLQTHITSIMAVQSRVAAVTGANKGIGLAIGTRRHLLL